MFVGVIFLYTIHLQIIQNLLVLAVMIMCICTNGFLARTDYTSFFCLRETNSRNNACPRKPKSTILASFELVM
jgi:hypothetical protein